jgi:hypothetical protein
MALKRLKIENETDAFVLAISCHQKSIKLAWEIGRALSCELQATTQYDNNVYFINDIKNHPYFKWVDPTERFTFHLIKNQSVDSFLVPQQKQIDFFFVVTGNYAELDFEEGTKSIKAIDSVLTAFPISLKKN